MRISDWSSDVCSSDLALARDLVDAADQFGEELAVQVGQDHADGVGAAAAEAARGVVGAVTQFVGHAEHALAYGLGHVLVTVEGPRHRPHRYGRLPCDAFDRDAHPRSLYRWIAADCKRFQRLRSAERRVGKVRSSTCE